MLATQCWRLLSRSNKVPLIENLADFELKSDANHHLRAMAHDAVRFVLSFRSIIEIAPLQVYCSALTLSPKGSTLREHFWNHVPSWIKNPPAGSGDWDSK